MKKIDPRLLLAVAAAGLVMALWLVLMSVFFFFKQKTAYELAT